MGKENKDTGIYFKENSMREVISTGCEVFNCALGGGFLEDHIINLVGDPATGKSGIAIETFINFLEKYPEGSLYYAESESAFDTAYAETIGFPTNMVTFPEVFTVEDIFDHLENEVIPNQRVEGESKCLYIIDSLDALSDRAEVERNIDDNTYGATKAKTLSQLFRRLVQKLEGTGITLLILSQVRDSMNTGYGAKKTRSGGKALEFYSSQIVWLSKIQKIQKTIRKQEMPIGIRVRAQVTKNRLGPPFREANFPLYFSYGIDDCEANLTWLNSINRLNRVSDKNGIKEAMKDIDQLSDEEFHEKREEIAQVTREEWQALEEQLKPKRSKYGSRRG